MADYNLPASSCHFNGKIYQQTHDDLVLAGMAQRTIHGYLRAAGELATFIKKRLVSSVCLAQSREAAEFVFVLDLSGFELCASASLREIQSLTISRLQNYGDRLHHVISTNSLIRRTIGGD